jgi:hypothetical protein
MLGIAEAGGGLLQRHRTPFRFCLALADAHQFGAPPLGIVDDFCQLAVPGGEFEKYPFQFGVPSF